jgi:hypothetical protein
MKISQVRPRRGSAHEVTSVDKYQLRVVTQMQLARIQQLQSDLSQPEQLQMENNTNIDEVKELLRKEWNTLRMQLLRGVEVEPGPIRAFLRKSGNTQKLVVK